MKINIYKHRYDFDDMVIAITIEEFFQSDAELMDDSDLEDFVTYDQVIELSQEIKEKWKNDTTKSKEEYAYIQSYAWRYLEEKYLS